MFYCYYGFSSFSWGVIVVPIFAPALYTQKLHDTSLLMAFFFLSRKKRTSESKHIVGFWNALFSRRHCTHLFMHVELCMTLPCCGKLPLSLSPPSPPLSLSSPLSPCLSEHMCVCVCPSAGCGLVCVCVSVWVCVCMRWMRNHSIT